MTRNDPAIGIAIWLLKGPLPDRVRWAIANGFTGVSLLQKVMEVDQAECVEAASIIRDAGLNVTYHGNFGHKLLDGNRIDRDFVSRMMENILWWHANTGGVKSACFDSVSSIGDKGQRAVLWDVNTEAARLFSESLHAEGIGVGIENAAGPGTFCSIADFARFGEDCARFSPGMLLDLGHANIHIRSDAVAGETSIGEYLAANPLEILEVHVSDNRGQRDEHRHVGWGNMDLDAAILALCQRHFNRQITVEVCVDIQAGLYGASLDDPEQLEPILVTRAAIADSLARHSS